MAQKNVLGTVGTVETVGTVGPVGTVGTVETVGSVGPVGPVALVLLFEQFWLTLQAVLVILAIQQCSIASTELCELVSMYFYVSNSFLDLTYLPDLHT